MQEDNLLQDKVYTAEEVAQLLRVDSTTVRRWAKDGALQEGVDFFVLPNTGKRRVIRFTQAQLQHLLDNLPSRTY